MGIFKSKSDQKEVKLASVGYFALFRFATKFDYLLLTLGLIFTIIKSAGLPLLIITYGELSTLLVDRSYGFGTTSSTILLPIFGGGNVLTNATAEQNRLEIINDATSYGILMAIISLIMFAAGIGAVDMLNYAALKQVTRMRVAYFRSLLRQEVGWFDVTKDANVSVRIAEDMEKIRTGIGERLSHFLILCIGFVFCMAISFTYGWKLSLVIVGYVPIIVATNTIISKVQVKLTARESSDLSIANSAAEEVLSGIRTVKAFCGERIESDRYDKLLRPAQLAGHRRGLYSGVAEAIMRFMFYGSNALAYWYGVRLVLNDRDLDVKEYTPATLMIALFGMIVGADNISKTTPFLESFSAAQGAAASIFHVIDRQSNIDSMAEPNEPNHNADDNIVKEGIEFENVHFQYPSRPEIPILNGLNVRFIAGQTTALVGASGNGKSTCMQLLQRFYDPMQGQIRIDGRDIKSMHISRLRRLFAVVGQEPVLFATTIEENIRYGKPDASMAEIVEAAQNAGAHDFIVNLQQGYRTMVGERGCQMSGGQKQRIAIARALIQNPAILLLDEATSALDSQTEKLVQETLTRAGKGRTTLVVSHRQSAIRSADRIVFIDKGRIAEDGTHEELVERRGAYYDMMRLAQSDENHGDADFIDAMSIEDGGNELTSATNAEHSLAGVNRSNINSGNAEKRISKTLFSEHKNTQTEVRTKRSMSSINGNTGSLPSRTHDEETATKQDPMNVFSILKRILIIARPEWGFLVLATVASVLIGGSFPAFAIVFGEFYGALSMIDAQQALQTTNALCWGVLGIGLTVATCALLQTYLFNMTGVNLTQRIRSAVFGSMIRQDASWFDSPNNSTGALSVRLTNDASSVQGAIGYPISGIVQSLSQFLIGTVTGFIYIWKMALVLLPIAPLVIATVLFEAKQNADMAAAEASGIEAVTKIATEAISNIRTVASLRHESHVFEVYCVELNKLEKLLIKKLSMRGLINSLGQSIPFFGYALSLYYGGMLVANEGVPFKNIIKVSECSLYGTMILGQTLALAPAVTAAFIASHRIFKIADRRSRIQSPTICNAARRPDRSGTVHFEDVDFAYPTRPHVQVLNGLGLHVTEGQTVALVGASGCGKSTCVQLVQRLYDPDHGRIWLGLDDIARDIGIGDLRSKLSIVSQEPTLFDRTIAENIGYGEVGQTLTIDDIMSAARMANIHEFIVALPMGYETRLGTNGDQLSGGQKQRIAIARALVRNPRVLLLDEATSALDLQSEQMVQSALDAASSGRTCLVIAHRLSTVQNADLICVLQQGRVVEQGTHTQLMDLDGGLYRRLFKAQIHSRKA